MRGRPPKDRTKPDPARIGIERLRERLREEGVPLSHGGVHNAVNFQGMPAYLDTLHKNNKGENILLFDFEEVLAWLRARVVRYVPPASPASRVRDLVRMPKAR